MHRAFINNRVGRYDSTCGSPINVFPYKEGFETTNGGWIAGGIGSDWAWELHPNQL